MCDFRWLRIARHARPPVCLEQRYETIAETRSHLSRSSASACVTFERMKNSITGGSIFHPGRISRRRGRRREKVYLTPSRDRNEYSRDSRVSRFKGQYLRDRMCVDWCWKEFKRNWMLRSDVKTRVIFRAKDGRRFSPLCVRAAGKDRSSST